MMLVITNVLQEPVASISKVEDCAIITQEPAILISADLKYGPG
jgi:hypothetical protein